MFLLSAAGGFVISLAVSIILLIVKIVFKLSFKLLSVLIRLGFFAAVILAVYLVLSNAGIVPELHIPQM